MLSISILGAACIRATVGDDFMNSFRMIYESKFIYEMFANKTSGVCVCVCEWLWCILCDMNAEEIGILLACRILFVYLMHHDEYANEHLIHVQSFFFAVLHILIF